MRVNPEVTYLIASQGIARIQIRSIQQTYSNRVCVEAHLSNVARSRPLVTETFYFSYPTFSTTYAFPPSDSHTPACYFQIGKRSCAPLARPQQFLSWPGYVACVVVLTSRRTLTA